MAISYAHNPASIHAQTELLGTTSKLSKQFERLSSGLRINSASDDPAGLQVADSLRADTLVASVAIRNANDGLSMAAVTESALEEVGNILTRMQELAEQSANGTYTISQRSALQLEFNALGSEVERIAVTTEFNSFKLLSASSDVALQVGFDSTDNSVIHLAGVSATLSALGLSSGSSALSFSVIDTTTEGAQSAAQLALTALESAINNVTSSRGTLGATESRLSFAINHVASLRDNYFNAESQIRDADIATEVAELVRLQVLQQAGTAILAQANQVPALALSLLQ